MTPTAHELPERLAKWVDAGIITAEQAHDIAERESLEHQELAAAGVAAKKPSAAKALKAPGFAVPQALRGVGTALMAVSIVWLVTRLADTASDAVMRAVYVALWLVFAGLATWPAARSRWVEGAIASAWLACIAYGATVFSLAKWSGVDSEQPMIAGLIAAGSIAFGVLLRYLSVFCAGVLLAFIYVGYQVSYWVDNPELSGPGAAAVALAASSLAVGVSYMWAARDEVMAGALRTIGLSVGVAVALAATLQTHEAYEIVSLMTGAPALWAISIAVCVGAAVLAHFGGAGRVDVVAAAAPAVVIIAVNVLVLGLEGAQDGWGMDVPMPISLALFVVAVGACAGSLAYAALRRDTFVTVAAIICLLIAVFVHSMLWFDDMLPAALITMLVGAVLLALGSFGTRRIARVIKAGVSA